jgi:signal transduction histidine kinase
MRRFRPFAVPALLLVLLVSLANLQYRWIGQVSDLERQRMEASLRAAAVGFANDFDRELTRAVAYFHDPRTPEEKGIAERAAEDLERWRAEAPYPEILGEVYQIAADASGGLVLSCLHERERRFEPCPWPADLASLRQRVAAHHDSRYPPRIAMPMDPSLPGLVFPAARDLREGREGQPRALLVVRLDVKALREELLPVLTERHFGNLSSTVAVVDEAGDRVIYRSDSGPGDPRSGDVSQPLFVLRSFEVLRELHGAYEGRGSTHFHPHRLRLKRPDSEGPGLAKASAEPPWRLVVRHRDGSLQAAVARVRYHNLAVSSAIVLLLGGTIALLLAATRKAQRLARQQLEFVAGVSHELNTPLAAIRSAGQNLADGVVEEPAQVRRYGDLVLREGRRLSAMVEQVLEFAGIQAGRKSSYRFRPVELAEVVQGALADSRDALAANGMSVEEGLSADLPPVLADPEALRRAVRNLIENAVKYGGPARWVAIRTQARRGEVAVSVEDQGPGIPPGERSRIFEPFYRGAHAAVGNVPGSGLGLAIVRHVAAEHGGRVTVESGPGGKGSVFTIHLPAAEALETVSAPVEAPG